MAKEMDMAGSTERFVIKRNTTMGSILATNGEWYHPMFLGPGLRLGARTWTTRAAAERWVRGRGYTHQQATVVQEPGTFRPR